MIQLSQITKGFGPNLLYKNGDMMIRPGDRIGLVGPNGAGKTTLFRVLTGETGIDEGTVSIPNGTIIGYFSQDIAERKGVSAIGVVLSGAGRLSELSAKISKLGTKLENFSGNDSQMEKLLEELGTAQSEFQERGGYAFESRAKEILEGLGIPEVDQSRGIETFSGGWKMRIELGRILALEPEVLLMDEPTNHLDVESIRWLEDWLQRFRGSLVMTSHDRDFLNRSVNRIVEVANKTITTYSGNYDFYEAERALRAEQLQAAHQKQQDMLAKEEEFIARFGARASHAAQVQSRVKKLEKIDRIEIPAEQKTIRFTFPVPPRSGNDVVKISNLGKVWVTPEGREKRVFQGASAMVSRLEKVAVVGVNGAGKSTLLKIIADQTESTEGECRIGANVKVGYFSQYSLDILDSNKTLFDEVHDRVPESTIGYVRNLLGAFMFTGDDVYKKVGVLSGGEKSRLMLATILSTPVNLLILDEPTNHLDMRSREVLLGALKNFEGTVMIVSHDRYFLRHLATRVFELDRGELRNHGMNYEEYQERYAVSHKR